MKSTREHPRDRGCLTSPTPRLHNGLMEAEITTAPVEPGMIPTTCATTTLIDSVLPPVNVHTASNLIQR